MKRKLQKAINRKKVWDRFEWGYPGKGLGFFNRNHSLNCGCGLCKTITAIRRQENRQLRYKLRKEIKDINI